MAVREVLPEEYDARERTASVHLWTGPFPVDEEEAPADREDGVGGQLAGRLCPCYRKKTGCTPDVMNALINFNQSATSCPFRRLCPDVMVYTLPAENIVPLTIPDGFKMNELSNIHTEIVHKSWPFATKEKWIKYQITHFPSVLIETEDGRPVAWEVQHEYGAVGALHVEPEYRRSKLGSIVTRTLAEKMTKDGQLVFAIVEESNPISIAFHEKNGYVRMPFKFSCMGFCMEAKKKKEM